MESHDAPIHFSFSLVADDLPSLQKQNTKDSLYAWGLSGIFQVLQLKVDQKLMPHDADVFLRELLAHPPVAEKLKFTCGSSIQSIQWERLSCSVLSMTFFDCLKLGGIVGESGQVRGCYEEYIDGVNASDKLRELMANSESQNAHVFSSAQKSELIFHIFKVLSVGGAMCQPDDSLQRYLEVTKLIYKDLVSVFKNSSTGQIEVGSQAFQVTGVNGKSSNLFGNESPHHFCCVVVDPVTKRVSIVWKKFVSFW